MWIIRIQLEASQFKAMDAKHADMFGNLLRFHAVSIDPDLMA